MYQTGFFFFLLDDRLQTADHMETEQRRRTSCTRDRKNRIQDSIGCKAYKSSKRRPLTPHSS